MLQDCQVMHRQELQKKNKPTFYEGVMWMSMANGHSGTKLLIDFILTLINDTHHKWECRSSVF